MGYRTLADCVKDLIRHDQMVVVDQEIDPRLEAAAIQRRVYEAGGPALLFRNVRGCAFPMASNLFGTLERARFLFRDALAGVRQLVKLKTDPQDWRKHPWSYRSVPWALTRLMPKRVGWGPILGHLTQLSQLPQLQCWPDDGGPFITLPLVYSEDPRRPGWMHSNLGMYRVQMAGNLYEPDKEVGLHYQIHRGIGVHHAAALERGEALKVNIIVGGPPALTVAAVMPLPEGLPELAFAGVLGGRRLRVVPAGNGLLIPAEADFCITGTIDPEGCKPEGPFGDHLGYYSGIHQFPVVRIDAVYHRPNAIWPFTVVGRPPQEDTTFGELIHELTGPIIPAVLPGVKSVHAVDAAGVHPLLLAVGSERYAPYDAAEDRRPQEILTQANAILGQGQLSLAKYLWIVAGEDDPALDVRDIPAFFRHVLERADWRTDLHFQTQTTMDTLDYTGHGFNQGSKVVVAVAGAVRRFLPTELPADLTLPEGFGTPKIVLPGILAVTAPPHRAEPSAAARFCAKVYPTDPVNLFPLIILCDDGEFTARTVRNWLWVTFTRSNPAADIDGIGAKVIDKHWGCAGALVIDARVKSGHAPPLLDDPATTRRVEELAAPGGPLHGLY